MSKTVHLHISYALYMSALNIHDIVSSCGGERDIAEGEWPVLHLHTQRMKVCYVFIPTSFAFCVLVYLPLHAQFASDEGGRRGGCGSGGKESHLALPLM